MKKQITLLILSAFFSVTTFAAYSAKWQKAQGSGLDYLIYVPQASVEKPPSLMISLHGCTQHAEDLAELANWEETADANNMIVVLPNVPNGGVVLGCWDYYGKDHTEKNRHNGPLIALTESLLTISKLKIDKTKVFISGLSSGSGEAAILGCMRPDLFSGVALNSGPAVGSEQSEVSYPRITQDEVTEFCTSLAGTRAKYFSKQILSVIVSDQDYIVNPQHSVLSINAMQKIYQTSASQDLDLTKLKGANTQGHGQVFQDAQKQTRVSYIVNKGLGHAWASGKGPGRADRYVNPASINYPAYLADLFGSKKTRPIQ